MVTWAINDNVITQINKVLLLSNVLTWEGMWLNDLSQTGI
jgi:hypothetical protein